MNISATVVFGVDLCHGDSSQGGYSGTVEINHAHMMQLTLHGTHAYSSRSAAISSLQDYCVRGVHCVPCVTI